MSCNLLAQTLARPGPVLRDDGRAGGPRLARVGGEELQDFALGLAVLLFAAEVLRTAWVPRPIAYLMGLSGLTYLVQGCVAGTERFSRTHTIAIVLAWVLNLAWMICLVIVASRMQGSEAPSLGR